MLTKKKNQKKIPVTIAIKPPAYTLNLSKYHRGICGIDKDRSDAMGTQVNTDTQIDVYDVLMAFQVTCPARQHAIKKLLAAGTRGKATETQDLEEARQSVIRAQEILQDYGTTLKG